METGRVTQQPVCEPSGGDRRGRLDAPHSRRGTRSPLQKHVDSGKSEIGVDPGESRAMSTAFDRRRMGYGGGGSNPATGGPKRMRARPCGRSERTELGQPVCRAAALARLSVHLATACASSPKRSFACSDGEGRGDVSSGRGEVSPNSQGLSSRCGRAAPPLDWNPRASRPAALRGER
jgi:hypothetical protein